MANALVGRSEQVVEDVARGLNTRSARISKNVAVAGVAMCRMACGTVAIGNPEFAVADVVTRRAIRIGYADLALPTVVTWRIVGIGDLDLTPPKVATETALRDHLTAVARH